MEIEKRIDLFEIHEQEWLPETLKAHFREILSWQQSLIGIYETASPLVASWLQEVNALQSGQANGLSTGILDLCSGASGPIMTLQKALNKNASSDVKIKLTDLHPPLEVYQKLKENHDNIEYYNGSFDATQSIEDVNYSARTILSAFHHFNSDLAAQILADAAQSSNGIMIIDPFCRDLKHLAMVPVLTGLGAPLFTLHQPSLKSFLFNNITPLASALFTWDGFASVLRGYNPDELIDLTKRHKVCQNFQWHSGYFDYGFGLKAVYLSGVRKE